MITQQIYDYTYNLFEYPEALIAIIPLIILTIIILSIRFVKIQEEKELTKRRKRVRIFMFLTRAIIISLLLIAIASPYFAVEKTIEGDPFVRILIDNSSSMQLFDTSIANELKDAISKELKVEVKKIGDKLSSPIGDEVLDNMRNGEHILLVSDGNSNQGALLGDVALYASKINSTINTIKINPKESDARVMITGPSKTLENIENTFTVDINRVGNIGKVILQVTVDGENLYNGPIDKDQYTFTRKFQDGYHRIEAKINTLDLFQQNNLYYKTVKVVPKPKLGFFSEKESPMLTLLKQVYEVDEVNLDNDLSKYHSVIINDINADKLERHVDKLNDFISDGNGMMVVGGVSSYDRGAYKDSEFESLLPVFVASAGKEEGDINIVVVIDISGSTGSKSKDTKTVDIEKAQTVSVLNDLKPDNRLAVVAFNSKAYIIDQLSYIYEKTDLVEKVAKLKDGGGTLIDTGIMAALDLMRGVDGAKNIIIISDGITQLAPRTYAAAELASQIGAKIYTVGVGPRPNENLMKAIASMANGIYYKADQSNKLRILFGDTEGLENDKWNIVILNPNHFITEELELKAGILGYNQVVPKTTAQLLATTSGADPLLTVWRYGLGRVAAYTTDDGTIYGGEVLGKEESKLITRTINWLVGDPDRRAERFVDISDTEINIPTEIMIKSDQPPKAEGIVFYKTEENMYKGTIIPTKQGFQQMQDAIFAVNYNDEYTDLGINEELENIVTSTGGQRYEVDDARQIIQDIKQKSKKTIVTREPYRWPFIIVAIIIFLLEILVRKMLKSRG